MYGPDAVVAVVGDDEVRETVVDGVMNVLEEVITADDAKAEVAAAVAVFVEGEVAIESTMTVS